MNYSSRMLVVVCFLVALLSTPATAELTVIEGAHGQQGLTVFKMTLTPAAEPVPALKHRLTLRPHELKPGNAAMHYVRVHAENTLSGTWQKLRELYGEDIYDWCEIEDVPIKQMPLEKIRFASTALDEIVEQFIQPGTRCGKCDWGLELQDLRGMESITFLLPEFQSTRTLARILALRTRLRIAEGQYDDAIEHMRMNYRLGKDVGQEMLLVCNLIGMAIEGITNETFLDFVSAPDSPNLYWALTELPEPLADTRTAIRSEMSLGLRTFSLLDVETAEYSEDKWSRLVTEGMITFQQVSGQEGFRALADDWTDPNALVNQLASTAFSVGAFPMAKERLLRSGIPTDRIEKMPVGQVLLVDAAREYQKVAYSIEKWWYLPYPLSRDPLRIAYRNSYAQARELNFGKLLAWALLPAVQAVKTAEVRLHWQRNALLTVEALRMHAAETGALPAALDEVQIVPVPKNPITEKPFLYRLEGDTAVLELPFSDGMPGVAWRFDIQLAK